MCEIFSIQEYESQKKWIPALQTVVHAYKSPLPPFGKGGGTQPGKGGCITELDNEGQSQLFSSKVMGQLGMYAGSRGKMSRMKAVWVSMALAGVEVTMLLTLTRAPSVRRWVRPSQMR